MDLSTLTQLIESMELSILTRQAVGDELSVAQVSFGLFLLSKMFV